MSGSIPKSFSNLIEVESLDLSHNRLSGEIPPQLIELTFLAVFSVACNNLSGRTPDMKAQFGTFDASSYDGNPFLCGVPLEKTCGNNRDDSPPTPTQSSNVSDEKWYKRDQVVFFTCFSVTYIMFFLGVIIVLYINPHWRLWCFNLAEDFIYSCYFCVANTLGRIPGIKAQFGTFDASNYEGNPFLCELPLEKNCTRRDDSSPTPMQSSDVSDEKWYKVDQTIFFTCFSITYIMLS
nr:brassinosteroid lrr receptor kinase brl3 [Quercus suber]